MIFYLREKRGGKKMRKRAVRRSGRLLSTYLDEDEIADNEKSEGK